MEPSKQVERLHIREDDYIEISCTLLALEQDKGSIDEVIHKIATSINVQLALEQENQEILFIPVAIGKIQHILSPFYYYRKEVVAMTTSYILR
jgi:type II secretory pathway component PulF